MTAGGKRVADALAEQKALLDQAASEQAQLELLEPLTPLEMAEAQEALGENAGRLAVMREARRRRGRPKGVRNKRTDDFVKYASQFGVDPARVLMEIASTDPEVLVERSAAMDPVKKRLAYGEAQSMRIRAAETLMPYFHGKKPLQVDMNFSGLSDLVIAGVTHSEAEVQSIIEADFTALEGDE